MHFNTGTIPAGSTAILSMQASSVTSPDNRDYMYCGSTYLWTTTQLAAGTTLTKDVSSCVDGHDLSSEDLICSENAWNSNCGGGFFYGTTAQDVVLGSATLTVTVPGSPAVTTGSVSDVGSGSATVGGTITSIGSSDPSQYGIAWSTSHDPTTSDNATQLGATTTTGTFSSPITGLAVSTTYYARAYVTNTSGTAYGSEVSFTTVDATPPVISAIASTTNQTSATITWTTDENASSTVNYGTTAAYGAASTSDSLATAHSVVLTGLATSTTYHFQVASADASGNVATSSDLTFRTALNPIGYWKLDETSSTSDAVDSIGTNTGIETGSPDVSTDTPNVNFDDPGSRAFDGSNYLTLTRPVQDNFTICAWVKTTSAGGGTNHWQSAPIMDSETGGVAYDFGFGIGNGGKLMYGNGGLIGGSMVDRQVNGATTINDDAWHNVCVTRNATSGAVKLYVDAQLDGSGTTGTGSLSSNAHARIGYGYDGAALYQGLIDDVRVYDTDLSQTQLLSITQGNSDPDTPPDTTPPEISDLSSSAATTTSAIAWSTDEFASSEVAYSVDTSYASSTAETDTAPRVTSHAADIDDLLSCTQYNYVAVSADASGNRATSTPKSFVTGGCTGGDAPSVATSTSVAVSSAATTTLADSGRTLSVATPANFTATTSSVVIQIKSMPADSVLASIGKPGSLSSAASIAFDVTALVDNVTTLDSFDAPVTVSYTYTDDDVAGLDESTLRMYHYHDGSWLPLDDCSVDTDANTITCAAPSFSIFAIFGNPLAAAPSHSSAKSGTTIQAQVANLKAMGNTAAADALMAAWPQFFPSDSASAWPAASMPVRDLELGMTGDDVLALQKLLNANGSPLAASGVGSPGNETTYFGALTKAALAAYQRANGIAPAAGYFGPLTRSAMKTRDIHGIWW
jgi:hypothetical protein